MAVKTTKENPIEVLSYEELVQLRNVISNKEIDNSFIDKTSKIDEKPAKGFSVVVDDGIIPSNPTGLTATAGIQFVFLQWTYNAETDISHYEIWRNTTNNNATAIKIAQTKANVFADESVIAGTAYFYWIKAVDHLGNISGFNATAGSSATPRNVMSGDIVNSAIIETKLADLAVATRKIKDEAIIASKVWRGGAVITLSAQIDTAVIRTAHIGNLQVKRANIDNLAVNNAKIANATIEHTKIASIDANKINVGTLTGRTVQTALTGRRIRISSVTGLTDRVSFLDGNTEEGYLRLEQVGFNWEMSIGGLDGDMFTVGTSIAAGAPIYVSMPFFSGAGTGATGQVNISGGSGTNARAIGLSWSGGGAPTFRLDLSGRGITRIGNSLIPRWNDDLGTSANRWRNLWLSNQLNISGNTFIQGDTVTRRVYPDGNNTKTLGLSTRRWSAFYTNEINTRNINYSGTVYPAGASRVHGNLIPTTHNNFVLGTSTRKWATVHRVNEGACDLPTSNCAIDVIKKIKTPKIKKGKHGKRHYFNDKQFPDEMKFVNENKKKEIELTRVAGVSLQAIKELITRVEKMENEKQN